MLVPIFCTVAYLTNAWQLDSAIFDVLADEVGWQFLFEELWNLPTLTYEPPFVRLIQIPLHDAIILFMFGQFAAFIAFGILMFIIGYYWRR